MNLIYKSGLTSFGLLFMRLSASAMMFFGHGLGKMQGYSKMTDTFPDPLGMGSHPSLIMAIIGEAIAPVLVALGLLTRFAALFTVGTMAVAAFVVHVNDPWFVPTTAQTAADTKAKEMALLYLIPFATLLFTGPGRFSIDGLLFRAKRDVVVKA